LQLSDQKQEGRRLKVVVFDIGNVLLRWNPRNLYCKIFADPEQVEWFLEHVCDSAWNEAQDAGRSWAEAVSERVTRFPQWEAEIRAYDERWMETLDGEIDENVRLVESLSAARVPLYAITNFSKEKFELARTHHRFFGHFHGIVVSGEVGLIKPDPRIFHLFLDRYGLEAAKCIFIDDSATNIVVADAVGMKTVHYRPGLDLAARLRGYGLTFATTQPVAV
jgi:HAD superfamily hydrolase (TIGR01509 family)